MTGGTATERPQVAGLIASAWVVLLVLGLAIPAGLGFFALLTGRPFESSGAVQPVSDESRGYLLAAQVTATVTAALLAVLGVLARRRRLASVAIKIPFAIEALAALLLWQVRPA